MKYLLDTDHISVLQQQAGPDYDALAARISRHSQVDLGLSVVSFHEQILGCHTYLGRARVSAEVVRGYGMLGRLLSIYRGVDILPFDAAAARAFDGLLAQRIRVGTMDLRIASIALSRGLILVTRNARDFRQVPDLVVEDWTRT